MEGNLTNITSPIDAYWSHPVTKGFRHLFYIVLPSESSFKHKEDVPDYVNAVSVSNYVGNNVLEKIVIVLE